MSNKFQMLIKPDRWPAFARGMLAYGSAEAVTRIVRLGSILIVARQISPELLGAAALALSLFELTRVLSNVGIGQRIITATESELEPICNRASQLFWVVCVGVTIAQLMVATSAWLLFNLTDVAAMLAVLSAVYFFMPAGLVQIFLAMRAQRMAATARVAATQNIADCVLTVVLVVAWPSAWAIILPKLLTAPLWLVMARATYRWTPDRGASLAQISEFATFGPAILGSELLTAARLHADKLLVGALLGTEALGLYYFAFNAGLGITQALVTACSLVLLPILAKADGELLEREFKRAFVMGLSVVVPLVSMQALLAPYYVPVIFGENWVSAVPNLALLACAAVPLFMAAVIGARFRAIGKPLSETLVMSCATITALSGLVVGAQFSLEAACIGFGLGLSVVLIPVAARQLFSPYCSSSVPLKGDL
ncbi:oligosaccharide flippase family protein [Altererythrobacter ishigakiensis]|uniref:O-antigen/teichoic acid export membrane protein n=1 Tax=Altererythrobacter ishigakiensis TaxID=476157 RepID=A0A562ULP7_9SPHN|nr:oligosaccharide flippase family protein [Altererythrobacter ishigakiensis]TWJ06534.1 O-antigen/teichoic acid export membrane protein [Altererythrobacter ishigakiensis]